MSVTAYLAVAVFVLTYILIATERIHRVAAALGGAAAMVVIGAARGHSAFFSQETGIDWNVIFLLLGMMILVGVLRGTGVFEFLAIWAAQRSGARPFRMMVLLCLITAGASALLDNVTTVLLIAPVTLLVTDRLALDPIPYLIAEAMASNIGGTATLVGDPPNIIIASRAGLTFNDFLINLLPIVIVLMGVFLVVVWFFWGRNLRYDPTKATALMALRGRDAITDPALLYRLLAVLGLVLLGFVTHSLHHIEPSLIALLGAGTAVLVSRMEHAAYLEDVEWETLVFFGGLFVMVGSLVNEGVIGELASTVTSALGDRHLLAANVILVGSAALSGLVDNIPYVATMSPLVLDLAGPAQGLPPPQQSLWWVLALGADLGGNATAVGASANVVITGIAKRNGHAISFWTFTKYGLVMTSVTILVAIPYVVLRYFTLA